MRAEPLHITSDRAAQTATRDRPTPGLRMRFDLGASTDAGRRPTNEDHHLIADLDRGLCVHRTSVGALGRCMPSDGRFHRMLMVVADGVGGQWGGDRASAAVVREVAAHIAGLPGTAGDEATAVRALRHRLAAGLRRADQRVRCLAPDGSEAHGPATTATVACIEWPVLLVAHVGDSRAYVLREGRLHRLTSDHTLGEAIRAIDGEPPAVFDHVLTNAIGGPDAPNPDLHTVQLHAGDVIMLCTDGVTNALSDAELEQQLRAPAPADTIAARLVQSAYHGGSDDNLTVVIARVR